MIVTVVNDCSHPCSTSHYKVPRPAKWAVHGSSMFQRSGNDCEDPGEESRQGISGSTLRTSGIAWACHICHWKTWVPPRATGSTRRAKVVHHCGIHWCKWRRTRRIGCLPLIICHTTYSCKSERKRLHNSARVPCHWLAQRKRTAGSSSWSWDQGVLSSRSALCKLLSLPSWFIHYLRYWISMQLPMSAPGVFGLSPVLGRVSQYRPKLPRSQLVETARLECCSAGIIYPSAFCHQTWHWEENTLQTEVLIGNIYIYSKWKILRCHVWLPEVSSC